MFEMILLFVVTASVDVDVHSIEIESDNATHSVQESRYEWTGNVVVTEPAYTLTASTVIVYLDEMQEPCKVTAVGKPVEAFGPYEGENATVSGEVILYDCEREKIRIARNATVNVPSESMSLKADNIIYDVIAKQVHATGNRNAERVELRLDPVQP